MVSDDQGGLRRQDEVIDSHAESVGSITMGRLGTNID